MSGLFGLLQKRRWRALEGRRSRVAASCRSGALARWLRAPLPAPETPFDDLRLLALDLELTGLDPRQDRILSIGWVPIEKGRIRLAEATHCLVAADCRVGQSATIHGIVDADMQTGDALEVVLERFAAALTGRLPVVHHAPLDQACLERALATCFDGGFPGPVVDTLAYERRSRERRHATIRPGDLRLGALRDHYGLPATSMHNALVDALATAELLLAMASGRGRSLGDLVGT